jgi:dihydrodipicolinate synthase/N-acetylneuraminate lyase
MLNSEIRSVLFEGTVIPAHPLALTRELKIDEPRQRRLTQYYIASGVGGLAVGVHTTQFEIRSPQHNMYEQVLKLAAEEIAVHAAGKAFIKVAGICGPLAAAVDEAKIAKQYGYHLGLLSMGGLNHLTEKELIDRTRAVAEIIPVFGFYLQPAVGGRVLSFGFWKAFSEIENVCAIKVAAFNRYQSLDVVRAVCESSRADHIALYTGNDDNIIADLVTTFSFEVKGKNVQKKFVGGLLGNWAVWTGKAVEIFNRIKVSGAVEISSLLTEGVKVTDMNAAIFDPSHQFKGSIAGIHYVLQRQGLLDGLWCLNPAEMLSDGQIEEIERVCKTYPELTDDSFIKDFIASHKI